ncbi:B3 domain-containing transcription repressor VAL2-like isoform X1 [Amaranthus tricolor]|uniref:B3 domain-containing transcription repressor VAL2-like isoform X1 n=1 Tax=Amaranthus tricolor TaxID=29722 RepID=UPI002587A5FA|nr:B3 domain-containing transcription repressor VAL2-like isoform X1 [Amaranthus tricolor]
MSLHLYEANDLCGVTCKVCIGKKSLVSDIGTSNASSSPEDSFQSDDSSSFPENVIGESEPPNDENQNTDTEITEGDLDQYQLPNSGLIFLFEKHLTPADCDAKSGRLQLTKLQGEKLLDQTPENRIIYVDVEDIVGNRWNLKLRWWSTKNGRRYIFDGTRKCCQKMQWNAGDTLKFYRQISDGKLILELQKIPINTFPSTQ